MMILKPLNFIVLIHVRKGDSLKKSKTHDVAVELWNWTRDLLDLY